MSCVSINEESAATSFYISNDMYDIWKLKIEGAKSTILIISPYFNNVLLDLIKLSNIERKNVRILTRISSDIAWEDKNQLSVALRLIEEGVQLRCLANIHAKLLIVDNTQLTLGSQNFTSNGRRAKEASVLAGSELDSSRFLDAINIWWEEATPVSPDSLINLLNNQERIFKDIEQLKIDANKIFDEFYKDCVRRYDEKARVEREKTDLNFQVLNVAYARMSEARFTSETREIIKIKSKYNLEEMLDTDNNRSTIHHCGFYPLFVPETNRMIYAKITKTRISYVISETPENNDLIEIQGIEYSPHIKFSDNEFNINIKLKECETKICLYDEDCKFDGNSIQFKQLPVDNILMKKLESIVFRPLFLRNYTANERCKGLEEFFTPKANLKITIKNSHGFNVLICEYL